jgi:hypothetical protein
MTGIQVTHIGGPTALIEVEDWRLLTDPTFDPPGRKYSFGWGASSRKLRGPAVSADDVGPIDAVLLSPDHRGDNLDDAGRAFLPRAKQVEPSCHKQSKSSLPATSKASSDDRLWRQTAPGQRRPAQRTRAQPRAGTMSHRAGYYRFSATSCRRPGGGPAADLAGAAGQHGDLLGRQDVDHWRRIRIGAEPTRDRPDSPCVTSTVRA